MTKKIYRSIIAVAMTVLLASLVFVCSFLYENFNSLQASRLKEELALAESGVEAAGIDYFSGLKSELFRFTLVAPNGTVLYDSQADISEMESHADRVEIASALATGMGRDSRFSFTLTEKTVYEAVRLADGNVLRISTTQVTLGALVLAMLPAICAIILFSLVIATVLSQKMAKSIVKPLENLDLEAPADNDTYEELTPILSRLNRQHKQITEQVAELHRREEEFEQITSSMNEGLVLLDDRGSVLSINGGAKKIFGVDDSAVGSDFLTVDRSTAMSRAVKKALGGRHCELREERNGSVIQFVISPTVSEKKICGVVMICIDVTETAFAERARREFTANVSHELKTPLQSIIGSAELLESGLAKPEDTGRFIGNIKTEAARLVALINDIIRLSQLDEEAELPIETVDLFAVSDEAREVLSSAAAGKQVSLSLTGEPCEIRGVRRYLYEIVYNLCDNAIRYNRDGGSVDISVEKRGDKAVLTVSDTGIGIPPEHQARIFERFYRVDKSHSKETGGTGLGLSIVKHAAAYHSAAISLESTVGKGTVVTVAFQLNDPFTTGKTETKQNSQ